MNISRPQQRVLHVLAQGGCILHTRIGAKIVSVTCYTRDHLVLSDCTLNVFLQLRRKRLIASQQGSAYRISRKGLGAVRAQLDNR